MGASVVGDGLMREPELARTQVARVLSSSIFCESPTQQKLLRYLIDHMADGQGGDLKEYTIGAAVFRRGADFDPRNDSIVRVQVGVLRKKLAAYYAGPGSEDQVIIDIPRGHYVPQILMREAVAAKDQVLAERIEPGNPVAVPPVPRRWAVWAYLVLGVLIGAVASRMLIRPAPSTVTEAKAVPPFEWRDHPVWKGFFSPGVTTRLAIGVPFIVTAGGVFARDTQVNAVEDIPRSEPLRALWGAKGPPPSPVEIYTGVGEAEGISLLTRFFHGAPQDLPLTRNRLTKWQDLAAGNLIFLASLRFRILGRELDRPSDFEFLGPALQAPSIHNLRPRPGESMDYKSRMAGDGGTDYALVTVWPGTLPGRRIMAIGGTHTWGTDGAAEYITDGPSLRELLEKLGPGYPAGKTGLQILVRVDVKDSQVASTVYVTHHWLP